MVSTKKKKDVLIIIPTHNDRKIISNIIRTTIKEIKKLPEEYNYKIVIAENDSNDGTKEIGKRLGEKYKEVIYSSINEKGRGIALKDSMQKFNADIYCYMDSDLATDIKDLRTLIEKSVDYDIVMGNRYHKDSITKRKIHRFVLSKILTFLINIIFTNKYKDLQCGFKAFSKKVVDDVFPLTKETHWLFDTEVILLSDKKGMKICEIPIVWKESKDSHLNLVKDTIYHMVGLFKMKKRLSEK